MPYTRIIKHLDSDASTVISDISDNCTSAWFELLRIGGCGAGEVVLKDSFADRGTIDMGDHIAFEYSSGDRWYLGRIESIQEESPNGVRISLFGLWATLAEVYPGGFAESNVGQPHRYARSDWFVNDPDHTFQTYDQVNQPDSMVNLLFSQYITQATNISLGSVNTASLPNPLDSFLFRGEESAQEILRMLALYTRDASVGVNEDGELFFTPKNSTLLKTFQEGTDCESLSRSRERKLFYNRLLLTGGYIYLGGQFAPSFYRYRGNFHYSSSIATYGEKTAQIFVPWIRRNQDATTFAKEFFYKYAEPVTRVTLTSSPQTSLLNPWSGEIAVNDRDGTEIIQDVFEKIKVYFDQTPYFEIELGPEDLQFPPAPEDQRFEIPDPSAKPFNMGGVYTGFSGSQTGVQSQYTVDSDCPVECHQPITYNFIDDGGNPWNAAGIGNIQLIDGSYGTVDLLTNAKSAMGVYFRGFGFNATPGATLGVKVEVHAHIVSGPGSTVKVALMGPYVQDNPRYLPSQPIPLASIGGFVEFGGASAGAESWKLEVPLDSDFVNNSLFGVLVKIEGPGNGPSTVRLDGVKICISEDCFPSSSSLTDTVDDGCIEQIGGYGESNMPVEESGDVVYVLGMNAAGCWVLVPVAECSSGA